MHILFEMRTYFCHSVARARIRTLQHIWILSSIFQSSVSADILYGDLSSCQYSINEIPYQSIYMYLKTFIMLIEIESRRLTLGLIYVEDIFKQYLIKELPRLSLYTKISYAILCPYFTMIRSIQKKRACSANKNGKNQRNEHICTLKMITPSKKKVLTLYFDNFFFFLFLSEFIVKVILQKIIKYCSISVPLSFFRPLLKLNCVLENFLYNK